MASTMLKRRSVSDLKRPTVRNQSTELDICSERVILQFLCVGCWAGVTYLRYTVLTSPKKGETAVHCCDPTLSLLVMLVSRNIFHVVSALQSIVCLQKFYCLESVEKNSEGKIQKSALFIMGNTRISRTEFAYDKRARDYKYYLKFVFPA